MYNEYENLNELENIMTNEYAFSNGLTIFYRYFILKLLLNTQVKMIYHIWRKFNAIRIKRMF